MKKETKRNKRQCPLSSVQVQDAWRQSGRKYKQIDCHTCSTSVYDI